MALSGSPVTWNLLYVLEIVLGDASHLLATACVGVQSWRGWKICATFLKNCLMLPVVLITGKLVNEIKREKLVGRLIVAALVQLIHQFHHHQRS